MAVGLRAAVTVLAAARVAVVMLAVHGAVRMKAMALQVHQVVVITHQWWSVTNSP